MFKGHWDLHRPHHSGAWHCIQKALSQHWSLAGAGKKQSGLRFLVSALPPSCALSSLCPVQPQGQGSGWPTVPGKPPLPSVAFEGPGQVAADKG